MIFEGNRDHIILIALGARRVSDITDDSGAVTGVEVEPPIDVTGYDAAVESNARKRQADTEYAATEGVLLSFFEAGVPFTQDWRAYRKALREISSTGVVDGTWPKAPVIPDFG